MDLKLDGGLPLTLSNCPGVFLSMLVGLEGDDPEPDLEANGQSKAPSTASYDIRSDKSDAFLLGYYLSIALRSPGSKSDVILGD